MHKHKIIYLGLIIITLSSCSKKLIYLSDLEQKKIEQIQQQYLPYKVQPYDYLDISIISTDEKINQLFNSYNKTNRILQVQNPSQLYYFWGYRVNDSGYIFLPVLNFVKVKDKTVDEIQAMLQNQIDSLLKETYVKVKLINFQIFFIGEINQSITFYKDKINILEAIAQIGGIPYTADKKNVFVLRRQDSILKVYTIDLTSKNLLENQNFYLHPFDILYFRPTKGQVFRISAQDYYMITSLLTTTISIITLILSLKK